MLNNAAEYANWRQTMLTAASTHPAQEAATMLSRAIIELLATDQFYGELLTRLPRQLNAEMNAPFALSWVDNQLVLQYAPQALAQTFTRFDQLQAGLKHVALHVVWQHPLRYRNQVATQQRLVTLATDLAVNQYVTGLPATAISLAQIQAQVPVTLPQHADSGTYLRLLRQQQSTNPEQPNAGQTTQSIPQGPQHRQPSTGQESLPATGAIDDTRQWSASGQLTNPNLAQSRLRQLAKDAWQQTTEAGRGLVAGHVAAQLDVLSQPAQIDWRQLLVRGLGQIPSGKKASHARFNRRQPARMELPGQISDTRLDLQVYVDQSGSISDALLRQLLAQTATLTQLLTATITIKPFDAIVQPGQTYQVSFPQQVRFARHGGGGTAYQPIFDDLARHHQTAATTLALILTDGRGEAQIDAPHFTNVIWLLARPTDKLSIQPVVGQVVNLNLGDDPDAPTT